MGVSRKAHASGISDTFARSLLLFADAVKRGTKLPFRLPPDRNPILHRDKFLEWICQVPETRDLVRSAHLQGLTIKTPEEAQALLERQHQHTARMTEASIAAAPPRTNPGHWSVYTDSEAIKMTAIVDFDKCILLPESERPWILQCPICFEAGIILLLFGSQNAKHTCTCGPDCKEVIRRRGDLWHTTLASPMDILLQRKESLQDCIKFLDSTLGIAFCPALECLPRGFSRSVYKNTLAGVMCVWEVEQATQDPRLVKAWKEYQAVTGIITQTHVTTRRDGYYVAYNHRQALEAAAGVISGEKPGILVFTNKCKDCCFIGILCVKEFV